MRTYYLMRTKIIYDDMTMAYAYSKIDNIIDDEYYGKIAKGVDIIDDFKGRIYHRDAVALDSMDIMIINGKGYVAITRG